MTSPLPTPQPYLGPLPRLVPRHRRHTQAPASATVENAQTTQAKSSRVAAGKEASEASWPIFTSPEC